MESAGVIELVGVVDRSLVFGDRGSGKSSLVLSRRSLAKAQSKIDETGITVGERVVIEICAVAETKRRRRRMTGNRLGEIAEAALVARVAELGFSVAKPWGDSDPYDFITQSGGKLCRVQVKSAHKRGKDGCYSFRTHDHGLRAYREDEIDALVAHIVPESAWYVLPVKVVKKMRSVKLYPGSRRKRSKYEKYREAWGELRG